MKKQLKIHFLINKSVIVFCFLLGFVNLNAQDYIKPVEGKGFYATVTSVESDVITYESNRIKFTIPKKEIVLIEFLERGVVIYNKEFINKMYADANNNRLLYSKGNNIYIPFSSNKIVQRIGSLKLRQLLTEGGFWNIVDCEQEAHCIMEYVFDGFGRDKAYLRIKNRNGEILYISPKVSASDFIPSHAGQESATKLYKKYIKKLKGNIEKMRYV